MRDVDHGGDGLLVHSAVLLKPDPSRTVLRPFSPEFPDAFSHEAQTRGERIVARILSLDPAARSRECAAVVERLASRHRVVDAVLERRYGEIASRVPSCAVAGDEEAARKLIGAYFSEEYSFEAAALFNPSMVPLDDQAGTDSGEVRFALSLRGIGEGHVSSVTFRSGRWSEAGGFLIDRPSAQAVSPRIEEAAAADDDAAVRVACDGAEDLSESVLFPVLPSQSRGIEDLRMVRFVEDDGSVSHLGTYTAFDGQSARTELLRAFDFRTFLMRPLEGDVAKAKGIALFPRKVEGRYLALGRQDSESIWLVSSNSVYRWEGGAKLVSPRFPWDFVQMGNCGAPIELDEGWLVLTHGVGTVRTYCMGAVLLDKRDPSRVLARTAEPILAPSPGQRDGYVPNVVYSCGAMVCGRTLLLPFGVADNFTSFASCSVDALLARMS